MTKLTLVSFSISGKKICAFVELPLVFGKPWLSPNMVLKLIGEQPRGMTITVG